MSNALAHTAPDKFTPPDRTRVAALVADLLASLDDMHDSLRQLLELARQKLAAMRAADTAELKQVAERECEALQTLFGREQQRDAAIARLAQSLHWTAGAPMRLSEIANRLFEPFCSRLRAKTEGLRETASALQQKNRVAAGVARGLHNHIRAVFEEVARANQETVGYGPDGRHEQHQTESWVDAVG